MTLTKDVHVYVRSHSEVQVRIHFTIYYDSI